MVVFSLKEVVEGITLDEGGLRDKLFSVSSDSVDIQITTYSSLHECVSPGIHRRASDHLPWRTSVHVAMCLCPSALVSICSWVLLSISTCVNLLLDPSALGYFGACGHLLLYPSALGYFCVSNCLCEIMRLCSSVFVSICPCVLQCMCPCPCAIMRLCPSAVVSNCPRVCACVQLPLCPIAQEYAPVSIFRVLLLYASGDGTNVFGPCARWPKDGFAGIFIHSIRVSVRVLIHSIVPLCPSLHRPMSSSALVSVWVVGWVDVR